MKVKQLKIFLGLMSLVLARKAKVPILESILLEPGNLTVSDLDSTLSIEFNHSVSGTIPFDRFKRLVSSLESEDDVSFEEDLVKKHVYVKINGKIEAKYLSEEVGDWPERPKFIQNKAFGHLSKAIINSMSEAMIFASNDDLRPAIMHVALDSHVAATDGRILFFRDTEKDFDQFLFSVREKPDPENPEKLLKVEEFSPVLFARKTVSFLFKANQEFDVTIRLVNHSRNDSDGERSVNYSNSFLEFKAPGLCYFQRFCEERFPEWRNIVPNFESSDYLEWQVEKFVFEKAIKLAAVQANASSKEIRFKSESDGLVVKSEDLDYGTAFHKKIGCRVLQNQYSQKVNMVGEGIEPIDDGPKIQAPFEIAFNAELVLKILHQIKSDQVQVFANSPNRAAVINKEYLIMPLTIKS